MSDSTKIANSIANFIIDACKCLSCGEVFDGVNHPHTDEDCIKGRAVWDTPETEEVAYIVRERLIKHFQE